MDYFNQIKQQRIFFDSGVTHDLKFRLWQLHQLKNAIRKYEAKLLHALAADLGKSEFESYSSEIGFVYHEIDYVLKHLASWVKPQSVRSPIMLFYSKSFIVPVPLGCVLIIAPWNYPFMLLIMPLIGAIAAGNCVVVKPSEISGEVAKVIVAMLTEFFSEEYLHVVDGDGVKVVPELIGQGDFNHVFFTGSIAVGRQIASLCAAKLIPYTLELGGKSPAVIDKSANLLVAAKRLVWGKMLNSGQTCIAPDYALIDAAIYDEFILTLIKVAKEFQVEQLDSAGKIINQRQFERLLTYIDHDKLLFGGNNDLFGLKLGFTIIECTDMSAKIMQEEIFGPILPVIKYNEFEQMQHIVRQNRYPLALYLFSNDNQVNERIINEFECGAMGINNCLYHFINNYLPFGGVMYSGNGVYHGKYSFNTFTHAKVVVKSSSFPDLAIKYPPYTDFKLKILRLINWLS